MLKKSVLCGLLLCSMNTYAGDLDSLEKLAQKEFRTISNDLTAALSYKGVIPAEPLGVTGFDVGLEVTATKLESSDIWDKASGSDLSTLPIPKLHIHKGLPMNIDIGASYVSIPSTNIQLFGGELRYAIMEGGIATPAIAIRGAFSKMSGVDQLSFSTKSVELAISKGFAMITPYAGIGNVWTTSSPNVATLKEESYSTGKIFAGANLNLGLVNLAVETDKTGDNNSYSAKFGFRW